MRHELGASESKLSPQFFWIILNDSDKFLNLVYPNTYVYICILCTYSTCHRLEFAITKPWQAPWLIFWTFSLNNLYLSEVHWVGCCSQITSCRRMLFSDVMLSLTPHRRNWNLDVRRHKARPLKLKCLQFYDSNYFSYLPVSTWAFNFKINSVYYLHRNPLWVTSCLE